jgi:Mn-dependent DtxR family transcriptional regulator
MFISEYFRRKEHMNDHDREKILKLLKEKRVITSSELAKFLGISWNTAQSYLMELALDGDIIRIKKEGVNLWILK